MSADISEMGPEERLEGYRAKAESCYAQMYECRPHDLKDLKDDAALYYSLALSAAQELGRTAAIEDLEKKMEHLAAVYRQLKT